MNHRLSTIFTILVLLTLFLEVSKKAYAQDQPTSVPDVQTTQSTETPTVDDTTAVDNSNLSAEINDQTTNTDTSGTTSTDTSTDQSTSTSLTDELELPKIKVGPGDWLYRPKRWTEKLARGLTNLMGSEEVKLKQKTGYADLRLAEVAKLIDDNDAQKQTQHLETTINEYKKDAAEVVEAVSQKLASGDETLTQETKLIEALKTSSAKQLTALQFASTRVSQNLESIFTDATDIASQAAAVVADTIGDDPIPEAMINHLTELGVDNQTLDKLVSLKSRLEIVKELKKISTEEGKLSQEDVLNSLSFEVPKNFQEKFKAINTVKALKNTMTSSIYLKPTTEQEAKIKAILNDPNFKLGEMAVSTDIKPFIETQLKLAKYMKEAPMAMAYLDPNRDFAQRPSEANLLKKVKTEIEQTVGKDLENLPADQRTLASDLIKKVGDIYQKNFYQALEQSQNRGELNQFIDPSRISAPGLNKEQWQQYLNSSGIDISGQQPNLGDLSKIIDNQEKLGPPTWIEPPKEFINNYNRYIQEDTNKKQEEFYKKHYEELKESGVLEKRAEQTEKYYQNRQNYQQQPKLYQQPTQDNGAAGEEEAARIEKYKQLLEQENSEEVIKQEQQKLYQEQEQNRQKFQEQFRQGGYSAPTNPAQSIPPQNQNYPTEQQQNQNYQQSDQQQFNNQPGYQPSPNSQSNNQNYQNIPQNNSTTPSTESKANTTPSDQTQPGYQQYPSSNTNNNYYPNYQNSGNTNQNQQYNQAPNSGTNSQNYYPNYPSPNSPTTSQ